MTGYPANSVSGATLLVYTWIVGVGSVGDAHGTLVHVEEGTHSMARAVQIVQTCNRYECFECDCIN